MREGGGREGWREGRILRLICHAGFWKPGSNYTVYTLPCNISSALQHIANRSLHIKINATFFLSVIAKRELKGHVTDVTTCRFFPSGVVLLTGGSDMQLKIWSAEDGSCPVTLKGHRGGISFFSLPPSLLPSFLPSFLPLILSVIHSSFPLFFLSPCFQAIFSPNPTIIQKN